MKFSVFFKKGSFWNWETTKSVKDNIYEISIRSNSLFGAKFVLPELWHVKKIYRFLCYELFKKTIIFELSLVIEVLDLKFMYGRWYLPNFLLLQLYRCPLFFEIFNLIHSGLFVETWLSKNPEENILTVSNHMILGAKCHHCFWDYSSQ